MDKTPKKTPINAVFSRVNANEGKVIYIIRSIFLVYKECTANLEFNLSRVIIHQYLL